MSAMLVFTACLATGPVHFDRHEVADFPAGYQLAVGDIDGDRKPDVIALSTDANRVDWFQNPAWKPHAVARTERNIDLAVRDVDGDGRAEIALASGFYFSESRRGGAIQWLSRPQQPGQLWQIHPIGADPVVHRVRWADLDGDSQSELITGKRVRAHGLTGDPGCKEPECLYYYRWDKEARKFTRYTISGPGGGVGTGLQICVADLNGDGRPDLVVAGKTGTWILTNQGKD